ncbi:hypothetical protein F4860DRAFT_498702, partial [Xylaria cubensis]
MHPLQLSLIPIDARTGDTPRGPAAVFATQGLVINYRTSIQHHNNSPTTIDFSTDIHNPLVLQPRVSVNQFPDKQRVEESARDLATYAQQHHVNMSRMFGEFIVAFLTQRKTLESFLIKTGQTPGSLPSL